MKKKSVAFWIFFILAVICIIYAVIVRSTGSGTSFFLMWIAIGIVLLLLGISFQMEFWKKVPSLDADFESRRQKLEDENKRWRFVAKLEDGKGSVSLQEVDSKHPFYGLEGSNNIILLTTERYKEYPMMIQGYGAGASVTAAGVFADIMSIANI